MTKPEFDTYESLGHSIAQHQIIQILTNLVRSLLQGSKKDHSSEIATALEARLLQLKGEYLYPAPQDLPAAVQSRINSVFQKTFEELSKEIIEKVRAQ